MKKLEWKTEKRKIKDLKPAEYNPRTMSEAEERDLGASIDEFGAVVPIVINAGKRNNILIGGHQRTRLYAKRGIEEIEVMVPSHELTLAEEKKLNLRLNKNTGSWDFEKLKETDLTLLLEVGFGDDDLQALFDDVEIIDDDYNVQKAIKEIKTPRTQLGDLWELGNHRLLVGDSTDPEQVKKLMGNDLANVILSDPPYNIGLDYDRGIGNKIGKYGGSYTGKKDNKKDGAYETFIANALANALANAQNDCHVFFWCDERYIWILQTLFNKQGIDNKRVCLWIKNNGSPTPQVAFNKAYEPCVYGTRGRPALNKNLRNLNEILNKEIEAGNQVHDEILGMFNLWLEKRDNTATYEHPCLPTGTLVYINDKWIAVEKVKAGMMGNYGKVETTTQHIAKEFTVIDGIKVTSNHPFAIKRKNKIYWMEARHIKKDDEMMVNSELSGTLKSIWEYIKNQNIHQVTDKRQRKVITEFITKENCDWNTTSCGKKRMEKYQTDFKSTIKTDKKKTIELQTLNWLTPLHTSGITPIAVLRKTAGGKSNVKYVKSGKELTKKISIIQGGGLQVKNAKYVLSEKILNTEIYELRKVGNVRYIKTKAEKVFNLTINGLPIYETIIGLTHNTQKPVTLLEKPIKRCSTPGNIILDLFGGSGTTLIASEQIGRNARICEIDPVFATVILDRWERLTNKKAKKI